MDRMPGKRTAVLVSLMAFVVISCGQKPGVHQPDQFVVGAPGSGDGGVLTPGGDDGGGEGPGGGPILGPGPDGDGGNGGGGGGNGGGGGSTAAGSRVGITEDKIIIGLHAPTSGAAPVEAKAFKAGTKLYWQWLHNDLKKKVHGRTVEVIFENDQYTPSTAIQKCNEMARQAFLLVGGAGTDQINACAGFANQRIIPYLSPGVQEAGLKDMRTYFAVTMTYKQQMPMIVQLLKREVADNPALKGKGGNPAQLVVGHVRPNTPNFDDADDALRAAVEAAGWQYKVYTVVKEGDSTEAANVAQRMEGDQVDISIPITPPVFTLQLAGATGANSYFPLYAGVAISNNVNQMIDRACARDEFDGALFLSPWPGWKNVMLGDGDKDFKQAAQKYAANVNTRNGGGDLLLALWGIMKAIHRMFEEAGPGMTRESFIQDMQKFSYKSNFFPTVNYGKSYPFGAQDMNVLIGECDEPAGGGAQAGPQWVTYKKYEGLHSSF